MANGKNWRLRGEYFESCNCEVLCPCIVRGTNIDPTEGHCDVALAFHIVEGDLDGVALDGLNFIAVNFTPGPMAAGGWTSSFYVDARADDAQRAAMEQILSGTWVVPPSAGGP